MHNIYVIYLCSICVVECVYGGVIVWGSVYIGECVYGGVCVRGSVFTSECVYGECVYGGVCLWGSEERENMSMIYIVLLFRSSLSGLL